MNTSKAPNILTRRSFLQRASLLGGAAAGVSTIRDMRLMNSLMAADVPSDFQSS